MRNNLVFTFSSILLKMLNISMFHIYTPLLQTIYSWICFHLLQSEWCISSRECWSCFGPAVSGEWPHSHDVASARGCGQVRKGMLSGFYIRFICGYHVKKRPMKLRHHQLGSCSYTRVRLRNWKMIWYYHKECLESLTTPVVEWLW